MSYLVKIKSELKDIFFSGLNSVRPHVLVQNKVKIKNNKLCIDNLSYKLQGKVYMVGFGKAVMGMAVAMEELLGTHLTRGIISIPRGSIRNVCEILRIASSPKFSGIIAYQENATDNQPDEDTLVVTREIINLTKSLAKEDVLIVLISGGGSALLSMPKPTITCSQKAEFCQKLQNFGANIKELNVIRQKLSIVKGGGLAHLAYPATVISFILSDIIDDPINLIASGPTCYNPTSPSDIKRILQKYNIYDNNDKMNDEMKKLLLTDEKRIDGKILNVNKGFIHVKNFIIGNNLSALAGAKLETLNKGLSTITLFNDVEGLVKDVSRMYVKCIRLFCQLLTKSISNNVFLDSIKNDTKLSKLEEKIEEILLVVENGVKGGLVIVAGGEPSVIVTGGGKGGRNQELALQFSLDWFHETEKDCTLKNFYVVFLSAATDGQDGPTDAAGAFGYAEIISRADRPETYLCENNSHTFYSNFDFGRDLLKTGITGTNVMDLHLIYIKEK